MIQLVVLLIETHKIHLRDLIRFGQKFSDRLNRYFGSLFFRETINSGADVWESNRFNTIFHSQFQGI